MPPITVGALDLGWWDHLLAALFGLALPALSLLQGRGEMPRFTSAERIRIYWSNGLTLWMGAVVVLFAWRWAGRSWAELGLAAPELSRPGWTALLVGLVIAGIGLDTWLKVRSPEKRAESRERWRRLTPFMPETRSELAHSAFLAASAGVTEEIVLRGFLIHYVAALCGGGSAGLTLGVLLPALACGLSHAYQERSSMAKIVLLAAVFGALFLVTRSLWIQIVVHAAIDFGMGVLGLWLLRVDVGRSAQPPAGAAAG